MAGSEQPSLHVAFSLVRDVSGQMWASEGSSLTSEACLSGDRCVPGAGPTQPHFRDGETEAEAELESGVETALDLRLSPKYLALNSQWGRCGLSLFHPLSCRFLTLCIRFHAGGWGRSLEEDGGLGLQCSVMGTPELICDGSGVTGTLRRLGTVPTACQPTQQSCSLLSPPTCLHGCGERRGVLGKMGCRPPEKQAQLLITGNP